MICKKFHYNTERNTKYPMEITVTDSVKSTDQIFEIVLWLVQWTFYDDTTELYDQPPHKCYRWFVAASIRSLDVS